MEVLEQIKQPIADGLEQYKVLFDCTLQHSDGLLGSVLTHIRQRKGKMMRPMLVLLMAREAGEINEATLHAAVTLEVLHTASLVHDDVVDESSERRGQSSVNALYDNKVAVLVGDYLLSTSLQQAALTGNLRIIRLISALGKSLSEGELLQLSNRENTDFSEAVYFEIIRHKTAELFAACAQLGALAVGADDAQVKQARRFGEIVGICFQIRDDIFDYFKESAIGKPTGNDMAEGKLTLPLLYALRTAQRADMDQLALRVRKGEATFDEMARLVEFTKAQGGIAYAEQMMENYRRQGLEILATFRNEAVRRALAQYLDFVISRSL